MFYMCICNKLNKMKKKKKKKRFSRGASHKFSIWTLDRQSVWVKCVDQLSGKLSAIQQHAVTE